MKKVRTAWRKKLLRFAPVRVSFGGHTFRFWSGPLIGDYFKGGSYA